MSVVEIKDSQTVLRELYAAGLPAFPSNVALGEGATLNAPGMMLRDWFAGQFFAATISDREQWLCHMGDKGGVPAYDYVAGEAYQMADAMLKAREVRS